MTWRRMRIKETRKPSVEEGNAWNVTKKRMKDEKCQKKGFFFWLVRKKKKRDANFRIYTPSPFCLPCVIIMCPGRGPSHINFFFICYIQHPKKKGLNPNLSFSFVQINFFLSPSERKNISAKKRISFFIQ